MFADARGVVAEEEGGVAVGGVDALIPVVVVADVVVGAEEEGDFGGWGRVVGGTGGVAHGEKCITCFGFVCDRDCAVRLLGD